MNEVEKTSLIKEFINKNIVKIVAGVDLEKELTNLIQKKEREAVKKFVGHYIEKVKEAGMYPEIVPIMEQFLKENNVSR